MVRDFLPAVSAGTPLAASASTSAPAASASAPSAEPSSAEPSAPTRRPSPREEPFDDDELPPKLANAYSSNPQLIDQWRETLATKLAGGITSKTDADDFLEKANHTEIPRTCVLGSKRTVACVGKVRIRLFGALR